MCPVSYSHVLDHIRQLCKHKQKQVSKGAWFQNSSTPPPSKSKPPPHTHTRTNTPNWLSWCPTEISVAPSCCLAGLVEVALALTQPTTSTTSTNSTSNPRLPLIVSIANALPKTARGQNEQILTIGECFPMLFSFQTIQNRKVGHGGPNAMPNAIRQVNSVCLCLCLSVCLCLCVDPSLPLFASELTTSGQTPPSQKKTNNNQNKQNTLDSSERTRPSSMDSGSNDRHGPGKRVPVVPQLPIAQFKKPRVRQALDTIHLRCIYFPFSHVCTRTRACMHSLAQRRHGVLCWPDDDEDQMYVSPEGDPAVEMVGKVRTQRKRFYLFISLNNKAHSHTGAA